MEGPVFWIVQVRFGRPAYIFRTEEKAKAWAAKFEHSRIMKVKQVE